MGELACTICHENYKNTDEILSTSCGHIYHCHCFTEWRRQSLECPQCRFYNPSTHKIYLTFDELQNAEKERQQDLQELNLKLDLSLDRVGELEKQLKESEENFLNLQGQYNENEDKLRELNTKIEYLTLQSESREKALLALKDEKCIPDIGGISLEESTTQSDAEDSDSNQSNA